METDWLFGGKYQEAAIAPNFDDSAWERISLPHCAAKLSWQGWQYSDWANNWIYRRHFSRPRDSAKHRIYLDFDGGMGGTTPVINGHALPQYLGGYLPFHYEVTDWLMENDNVLAVAVDARVQNAPPEIPERGPGAIDFFQPGGIPRPVSLRIVPQIFISEMFATPLDVLNANRRVEITCSIDAAIPASKSARLNVELFDDDRLIAHVSETLRIAQPGATDVKTTLANLGEIKLWDVDAPHLYRLVATLIVDETPTHDYQTRIGFREARFELDGFFLNGRRLQIFGLCRHELFPYVGFAMPSRVMRRDAELLRHELNCNFVRCSHYPQTEAFLDVCDELGLLVWEELPGWGLIGDAEWQDLAVRDVTEMVRRDRNHPSIVVWGTRINETPSDPALFKRTKEAAEMMDGSRPSSGAMNRYSTDGWSQDIFAYNDYYITLKPPLSDRPYIISEAVGNMMGPPRPDRNIYRRAADPALQAVQAIYHAHVHDQGGKNDRYSGVVAWCAFDYGSPMASFNGVKCPGVVDVFRVPKLGASFYRAQVDPNTKPVIHPNFYWDFGVQTPQGPGAKAAIFSNCDRLEIWIDGAHQTTLRPQRAEYPHLKYPPFFVDLTWRGSDRPELRMDGYLGERLVVSRSFSSDERHDQFLLQADDQELLGDGIDATRLLFGRVDKFGATRPFLDKEVSFQLQGPGIIVGDNPFQLADSAGTGAVWIKSLPKNSGIVKIVATHSALGTKSVAINVRQVPL